ncbi:lysis protein [Pseudomonas sp. NPDC090755]|uniref:lysis protein n=1 Tax=Pseudomonas sp. NPDC090755 TaxID=3364481 RepID=UPI00383B3D33
MIASGWIKPVGLALLLAIACFSTWKVQDWRYGKQLADQARLHQQDLTAISNAAVAQARQALHDLDTRTTKERADDLAENDRLRRTVADGDRRLRIAGSCRAGGGNVPGTASATSLGDAGAFELAPAAGRSVFDIRAGIIADQVALRAAQAYIKEVCRKGM